MKILQVIQKPQLRGAEIFACQLSAELKKLGADVDVAYLFEHSSFDLDFDLRFLPVNGNQSKRIWDFGGYRSLARIIEEGQYDLVQANASDTLKYSVFSRKLFKWKTPIIYRNANKLSDFIRGPFQRIYNRWVLGQCDYYISVSENCRQDLINLLPAATNRSRTVSVGTYSHPVFSKNEEMALQRPVIINLASLTPEKNHSFLIEVFNEFYKQHKKGSLWIVGDGRLKGTLQQQVNDLSIGDRVTFWGYRKDAIGLLQQADMLVMPSKIEGIPAAILEALSVGVPVIASSVGGIPEVIIDNVNGFCIEQWSAERYKNRIEQLIMDSTLRDDFTKSGRETYLANFQMPLIARKFLSAYEQVLASQTEKD